MRLTDDEVRELFPEPSDSENLADLMRIVKSSQDRNVKVNKIVKKLGKIRRRSAYAAFKIV